MLHFAVCQLIRLPFLLYNSSEPCGVVEPPSLCGSWPSSRVHPPRCRCLLQVAWPGCFVAGPRLGPVWAWFGFRTYVDAVFVGWNVYRECPDVAKEGVAPTGDHVSDVGETCALRHRDIGDEIAPAYPEQSVLTSHVKSPQFPPVLQ